jgi:putative transposase
MLETSTAPSLSVRVLRLRLKDKHAAALTLMSREVNFVWNYSQDLALKVLERERRFISAFDIAQYTRGACKEGLGLHSQTVQAVSEEYVLRRKQFKKVKLRWRVSGGPKRSLGWIPFKASALRYRNGQVLFAGFEAPLSLWDSYGLAGYELGAGSICEDARGRWYLNICVKFKKPPQIRVPLSSGALGIDLGLKSFAADSDGQTVEAQRFYRDLEPKIASAQRAGKRPRVRALHAKVANRRKDFLHKLSTQQVGRHCAIFVGDVSASGLAKTKMAKSVLDAGWSTYRTMLRYKCDNAGVWFKEVNESYSTQTCHVCHSLTGPKGPEKLGVRAWTCTGCGTSHDRDVNASRNILSTGLGWLESEYTSAAGKVEMPDAVVNKAFAAGSRWGLRPDMAV